MSRPTLASQIETVTAMANSDRALKEIYGGRESVMALGRDRLRAAVRTLSFVERHADAIRAAVGKTELDGEGL